MGLLDRARELAGRAREKAGPLAEKVGPLAERAGGMAAKGVDVAAQRIDRATGGKYHDRIENVSHKVEGILHRDGKGGTTNSK
ncbi:hypothetical protein GCM10012275_60880 [Longimycelium tulufanense]|uniref:Antitoxin n=2 Tax=Longimycelium tulufanense TaxID=907463 RepID=A0A8J3FZN2_9PSEU|nr:hypothetical protein GCM10012275_60880 [Longimycelium tulufanense]